MVYRHTHTHTHTHTHSHTHKASKTLINKQMKMADKMAQSVNTVVPPRLRSILRT